MSPASPLPDPSFNSPCITSAQTLLHGCHCLWSCVCRTLPRASRCWGRGWDGGGVLHTNLSPRLRLRRRSRSANQTKARWLLHCQCLGLFPPAEENMIATALKNIWSFAPHRCTTSQMWRPDRSPPEGPSFLFQSGCFELSSAASPI